MSWQENESWNAGEEWKGDNYQPEFSLNGEQEHDELIARLAGILKEIADSMDDIINKEHTQEDLNKPAPKGAYVLDGEIVRPAKTYGEYLEGLKIENRRVMKTILRDGSSVSTVFLGLDHSFGQGTPILFETLGIHNGEHYCMNRYPTYEAALTGHRETVEELKIAIANEL